MTTTAKRRLVCPLLWILLFHSWLIVRLIPGLDEMLGVLLPWDMTLMLALLWVNIPGIPLHYVFGETYFQAGIGVIPQGVVGYGLVILFWIIVSILLGFATSGVIGWLEKRKAARISN